MYSCWQRWYRRNYHWWGLNGQENWAAAATYEKLGRSDRAAELFLQAGDYKKSAALFVASGKPARAAQLFLEKGNKLEAARLFAQAGQWAVAADLYEKSGYPARAAEAELEVGEVEDVAFAEGRIVDGGAVHEGAVLAAQVPQAQAGAAPVQLGVGLRDRVGRQHQLKAVPAADPERQDGDRDAS